MTNKEHYVFGVIGLHEPAGKKTAKVSPRDFLSWAEKDLKSSDERGRGNALSNIKKALHARVDEIIGKTHLRFSSDWKPHQFTTAGKLAVIRDLGIKHGAIVHLITTIRNEYEHGYIVPPLDVVKAYLGTCELWLENTYKMYDVDSIGIVNFPLTGINCGAPKANGSIIKRTWFLAPKKVRYFWTSKRRLVTVQPDGKIEEKPFKDFSIKEMLRLEAPWIKKCYTADSRLAYNQASLTDLFRRYRRWLDKRLTK